ncbi:helix-turn-helix transcriptional regulator [Streptomyces sp. NPDC006514]|uniref:helix-turn-helix domain-containing protein n=1 Tax=Streptomyces sp. NPDC006514 TaxID=3154308 RepID=UPI0033BAD764
MDTTASAIRELREAAGLSRKQLAEAAEISEAFLVKIERGERRPSPEKLTRIAAALGTTPQDVTTRGALLDASTAGSQDEMYRRLLRVAAIGGTAAVVRPLLGALVLRRPGLAAGAVVVAVAAARRMAQQRENPEQPASGDALNGVDPVRTRRQLIEQLETMSDEEIADLAALVKDSEAAEADDGTGG